MPFIGNQPADKFLTLEKQVFTTSATDTYTLDREVSSVNDIELFLNNVRQEPTEAYTISGTTLTLASAITASDSMYCIYQGRAVGTTKPANNTVTGDMLSKPFNYDSGTFYLDDTNNRVGIGTSSPSQALTVNGQMLSVATSGASFKNITPTTGNNYLWLGNTGNNMYVGKESSTGNTLFVGSSAYAGVIGNDGAYPLQFATNNNVRATIDSSGNVLVGTTNTAGIPIGNSTNVGGYFSSSGAVLVQQNSDSNIYLSKASGYSYNGFVRFFVTGVERGTITTNGSSISYNTTSDYRLKENVVDLTSATERLKQLSPKRFNFIADADTTVDGFLAHEVQSVVPEAINGEKDGVDNDGNPKYQGIDQSKLVPLLTASLKEAIAKIEELETRIATLEGN